MARKYKRDSKGRFASTGSRKGTRSNPLGEGPVKGTIAANPKIRARRLQNQAGGSGFGEQEFRTAPDRVGRAREAVADAKGIKTNAGIRAYGRRKAVGWRGKPYSGVEGEHDPRYNRNVASPKRRFKVK